MFDKRILIVEDQEELAEMMQFRLNLAGYEVELAFDAYEGNKQLSNKDFDLLVLDLNMPVGNGFSLLESYRKTLKGSNIPVLIVTGKKVDETLINRAKKNKVSAVFKKPYNSKKFLEKVQALVPA